MSTRFTDYVTLRQETLSRNALRQDKRDRIAKMTDFLNTQTSDIAEFDDKLVRKLVEKAIVYDDRIVVEFKSGSGNRSESIRL